jgi:ATP synthase protein I
MKNNNEKDLADKNRKERLAALEAKLASSRQTDLIKNTPKTGKPGFGNALKMSSEFISAILVGAGIGYLIDSLAGTKPWAMIVMLLLGFVAGVINVLRSSGEMADPYQRGWAAAKGDKKDQKPTDKGRDDLYDDEDE